MSQDSALTLGLPPGYSCCHSSLLGDFLANLLPPLLPHVLDFALQLGCSARLGQPRPLSPSAFPLSRVTTVFGPWQEPVGGFHVASPEVLTVMALVRGRHLPTPVAPE